jgi:hypothetical protein
MLKKKKVSHILPNGFKDVRTKVLAASNRKGFVRLTRIVVWILRDGIPVHLSTVDV